MAKELAEKAKEAFLDDDFDVAVDLYSKAIDLDPNCAAFFADRAQANIKIDNFTEAVVDANKAIELEPTLAKAYLRKGTACMKLEEYSTAKAALEKGASVAPNEPKFKKMIDECDLRIAEEEKDLVQPMPPSLPSSSTTPLATEADAPPVPIPAAPAKPMFRHEFYQKPEEAVVTIFAKKVPKENVTVEFGEQILSVVIDVAGEEAYHLQPRLFGKIIPEKCRFEVLSTKVEIRLAKAEIITWASLEYGKGQSVLPKPNVSSALSQRPVYPSSKPAKDWDKLEAEVKKQEKDEKLDGDAAMNKFFSDIYSSADEDMRRAMNKSFAESNGTVLSTNWKEVGTKKPFMLILHLVQAQDQPGFINVDCGLLPRDSPYNALGTGLVYTSDVGLVSSGKTGKIAKEFEENNSTPNLTLRYFPDGARNCYNLNVSRDTNYMIKATFVYGNYDGHKDEPNFDLYLGPNLWATVSRSETVEEIIHVTKSDSLQVCLAKTGDFIPFINILELRPLKKNVYVTESGSLKLLFRKYFSDSGQTIRYPDDIYDRVWHASFLENNWAQVSTTLGVNVTDNYDLSQDVMATGATPLNDSETLNITWNVEPPTTKVYSYMHFAELETLRANDTREFNVMLNGNDLFGPYSPIPLKTETETNLKPEECEDGACILQLVKTSKSTLPPLLNAIEAFTVIDFLQVETDEDDAAAIKNVQNAYGLINRSSWQGDPCVPKQYSWDGLKCSYSDSTPPIINFLDLSASGLTGIIAPAIQNLTHLEILALSNNNLTGEVPEFLADLKSIMVIDLRGNNLSGPVPASLLQKKGLMLHLDDNPHILCTTGSCMHKGEGEKKSIIVPVVASIVSLAVIIGALILFLVFRKKKASKVEGTLPSYMQASDGRSPRSSEPAIVTKNKRFTYSQVVIMTNNFQRILGKGGFGIVYHGFVNGVEQVAVKILSHSSSQGYKQFKAEVELLLRVHHKNLVGLVGYCDEGENMALIYEYMANGDLKEHMSGTRNRFILNWETRLKIVIDSAQGLEYLHNGCKPLMVHRDVKTTNILLNEHFEAKLADFGLSRSFPIGGETHVSTVVAGTPGYLDPEYYKTNRLTEKSDVYSFGIVLLEMITNRPVIDQSREKPYISEWVGIMLTKGDIISIMDPSLNGDYDSGSVWKAVELAMSCLNPSSTRRPTMSQVLIALNECLVSENSRGGASRDMDSKSSLEVSLTFDTDVSPMAR